MMAFFSIFTLPCEALDNFGKYFPMKDTGHVTETLTDFLYFLGVICHLGLKITIKVRFFLFALENERTLRVNLCIALRAHNSESIVRDGQSMLRNQIDFSSFTNAKQSDSLVVNPV